MFKSFLLLILFLFFSINSYANGNDDNSTINQNAFTVYVDETMQADTGIQVVELKKTLLNQEIETFATRVDISPLFNTRKEFINALALQTTHRITFNHSLNKVQHLENLQRNNAVSTRKLLEQKSQLKIDKANLKAAEQQTENIRLHAQAQWGPILSHRFLNDSQPPANLLDTTVYLAYLPNSVIPHIETIFVHPFGVRDKALSASLISSAPISNPQQSNSAFLYLADKNFDAYYQRFVVWLPQNNEPLSGFIIPASALVWHLGSSYVYLQVDDELFKRVKISQKKLASTESYFIQEPLQEGDMLVNMGAQMLLSEEFRGQIPSEDDD